jgi:hypothetical protein
MIGPVAKAVAFCATGVWNSAARGGDPTQIHAATSAVMRLVLVPANQAVGQEVQVDFVAALPLKLVYLYALKFLRFIFP